MDEALRSETLLVLLIAGFVVGYYFLRWFRSGTLKPDPWGPEIEEEIQRGDAPPLCLRCLTPHDDDRYFCEECGLPVGAYVNWSPYLYIFSLGDALVTGVVGKFVVNRITVIGYLFFSCAVYTLHIPFGGALLAPFYGLRFIRHLPDAQTVLTDPEDMPPVLPTAPPG